MKAKIAIVSALVIILASMMSIPVTDADSDNESTEIVLKDNVTLDKSSYNCSKLTIYSSYTVNASASTGYSIINFFKDSKIVLIDDDVQTEYPISGNFSVNIFDGFSVKTIDDDSRNVNGMISIMQKITKNRSISELTLNFENGIVSEKKISDEEYDISVKNLKTLSYEYTNSMLSVVFPIVITDSEFTIKMKSPSETLYTTIYNFFNAWHGTDVVQVQAAIRAVCDNLYSIDLSGSYTSRESAIKLDTTIEFKNDMELIAITTFNHDTGEQYGYAAFCTKMNDRLINLFNQRLDPADSIFYVLECFDEIDYQISDLSVYFNGILFHFLDGGIKYDYTKNTISFKFDEFRLGGELKLNLGDYDLTLIPDLTLYSAEYTVEIRSLDTIPLSEKESTADLMKRVTRHLKETTTSIYSINNSLNGVVTDKGKTSVISDFKLTLEDLGFDYVMNRGSSVFDPMCFDFETINRITAGTGIYNNYNIGVLINLPLGVEERAGISLSYSGKFDVKMNAFDCIFGDKSLLEIINEIQYSVLDINRLVVQNEDGITSDVSGMSFNQIDKTDYDTIYFGSRSFINILGTDVLYASSGTSLILKDQKDDTYAAMLDGEASINGINMLIKLSKRTVSSFIMTEGSKLTFNGEDILSATNIEDDNGAMRHVILFDYSDAQLGYDVKSFYFTTYYCGEKVSGCIKLESSLLGTYITEATLDTEREYTAVIEDSIAYFYFNDTTTMSVDGKKFIAPVGALLNDVLEINKRTGYTFDHWELSNGTIVVMVPEQKTEAPIEIIPEMKECSFTITYDANGGKGTKTTDPILYGSSAEIISGAGFSLDGWTFNCWNTRADGNGLNYNYGSSASTLSNVNGSNITLYAVWKASIDVTTSQSEDESKTIVVQLGQPYGIGLANLIDTSDYLFEGWYVDGVKVDSSSIVKSNKNVVSKWIPREGTLKVILDDRNSYMVTLKKGATYAESIVAPAVPAGYEFAGWFHQENLRAVDMAAVAESGTVYASWTPIKVFVFINDYKFTYHYDDVFILPDAPGTMNDFDYWLLKSGDVVACLQPGDNFLVRNEIVVTAVPLKTKDVKVEPQFDGKKIESSSNVVVTVDGEVLAYPWTSNLSYEVHDVTVEYTDSTGSMHRMQKALIVDKNTDKEVFNFISDKRMKAYVVNEVNEAYIMSNGGLGALVGSSSGMDATVLLRASVPDDRLIDTLVTAAGKYFTILEEFDLTITKIMSKDGVIKELTMVDEVGSSIDIVVKLSPGIISKYAEHGFDLEDLIIYRTHVCSDGKVTTDKVPYKAEGSDGEYFSIIDGRSIALHVNKFSAYGIAIPNNLLVKVVDADGGKITVDRETAIAGDIVTVSAQADSGYKFAGWKTSEGVSIVDGKFAMPNGNVTISAVWEKTQNGNIALIVAIVVALLVIVVIVTALFLRMKAVI